MVKFIVQPVLIPIVIKPKHSCMGRGGIIFCISLSTLFIPIPSRDKIEKYLKNDNEGGGRLQFFDRVLSFCDGIVGKRISWSW